MTTYSWNQLYDRGTELFHEPPAGQLEKDLITKFTENPSRVKNEIEKLGSQIAAGAEIRSGWALLRRRLQDAPADVVVTDSGNQERAILNARRWIHNAGCYFDQERDVLDELFGQGGILAAHDSDTLRAEMAEAWRQERPRGVRAEDEHAAYMRKTVEDRKRIADSA